MHKNLIESRSMLDDPSTSFHHLQESNPGLLRSKQAPYPLRHCLLSIEFHIFGRMNFMFVSCLLFSLRDKSEGVAQPDTRLSITRIIG